MVTFADREPKLKSGEFKNTRKTTIASWCLCFFDSYLMQSERNWRTWSPK